MPEVGDIQQLPVPQVRVGEPSAWDPLFRRYQLPLYVYVFELGHYPEALTFSWPSLSKSFRTISSAANRCIMHHSGWGFPALFRRLERNG